MYDNEFQYFYNDSKEFQYFYNDLSGAHPLFFFNFRSPRGFYECSACTEVFFATTQNFWWYFFPPWVAMTPCGLVRGGNSGGFFA